MSRPAVGTLPRVLIVGGGLAGLAAAAALTGRGLELHLWESRRQLGGRAASFVDPASGEAVDFCQHVSMGCCTNLADFCRRTGIDGELERASTLNFLDPQGRAFQLRSVSWLPAPLHLVPSFLAMRHFTLGERLAIARGLLRLARTRGPLLDTMTAGDWLARERQPRRAIDQLWRVVLVSALGEEPERASLRHARKVFVDGFMASREAYHLLVPRAPLSTLFGVRAAERLAADGLAIRTGTPIEQIDATGDGEFIVRAAGNLLQQCNGVVVATPWRRTAELFSPTLAAQLPGLERWQDFPWSPITGIHLWFDRPITPLPHVALTGGLCQWLFNANRSADGQPTAGEHYYQVVVSASRGLLGTDRTMLIADVQRELESLFPAAREARLLRYKVVSDPAAVFSCDPATERLRPSQETAVRGLALAGDWTQTGWPSTMEGAVRSGYLAAETVLASLGKPAKLLQPDLPRGALARLFCGAADAQF